MTGRYIVKTDGDGLQLRGKALATQGNVTSTVNYGPVAWTVAGCN